MENGTKKKKSGKRPTSKKRVSNSTPKSSAYPVRMQRYVKGLSGTLVNRNKWWISKAMLTKTKLERDATAYETTLFKFLLTKGFKAEFQRIIFVDDMDRITGFYVGDIYLPKFNVIIEVDGGYHFTTEQAMKDAIRTSELRSLGYRVFRCKNEEVLDLEKLLVRLIKFLSI